MRFEEKLARRGLYPKMATDSPHLPRELLLRIPSVQMFDYAVGENDVELVIVEMQVGSISDDSRAAVAHRIHYHDRVSIQEGDMGLKVRRRPEFGITPNIENALAGTGS